jgi:transposase
MQITTIGIDLAKTVFQLHAVDADGATVVRKRLRRAEVLSFVSGLEPCLIGMEACATSHYWARELTKFGHTVKLMPPVYVKPYVKRGKNDATDAEAICEAVSRPNMRFVPVKSADPQTVLMLHRTRALLIRQQTMLANAFRAHLAELGIVVAQGIRHVRALIERVFGEGADAIDLPVLARIALRPLVAQLIELRLQIKTIEKELLAGHRTSQQSRRLETIPGVGFITATAIAATVTDPSHFRSSREFSAWLGLTPRQNSSGGKDRLGRVSKMGNGYLRSLIVVGATARIRYAREKGPVSAKWINALLEKKPARLVSVAVANKTARIAWALLVRKEDYRAPMPVAA